MGVYASLGKTITPTTTKDRRYSLMIVTAMA